ncbi:chemotaxis protein CheW [Solimonas terrae]|uniref:Chemotaxis protein CheW n=1 Tax=Solimonas terrae TaxID=1396819 RepID=A0A6M2BXN4_9GAMM|nr:chemotaxis protein CheW [Solimonas terrae]NGY06893.1 chemotaxis protein CheW [Solimonas terrae]
MSALARKTDGEFARWVCFGLGSQEYGLPILQVHEVLRPLPIEPVPGAPDIVPGVVNLRGQVVTVIDLRRYLVLPVTPIGTETRIVVVEHDGETFGLLVDRIGEVSKIALNAIKPVPTLHRQGNRYGFAGVVGRGAVLLTLLDVDALFAAMPR